MSKNPFVDVEVLHQTSLMQLMAREKIQVVVQNTKTAYFDPIGRRVIIPQFLFFISKDVADLFSAHEIAHALYSPREFAAVIKTAAKQFKTKEQKQFFVNSVMVFEDERIERLIKRDFQGLKQIFFHAYEDLHFNHNFFNSNQLNSEAIARKPFLDRANLFYKVGDSIQISFSEKEMKIVGAAHENNTFEDVVDLSVRAAQSLLFESLCQDEDGDEISEDHENPKIRKNVEQNEDQLDEDEDLDEKTLEDLFSSDLSHIYSQDTELSDVTDIRLPDPMIVSGLIIDYKFLTSYRKAKLKKDINNASGQRQLAQIQTNAKIMANEFESKKAARRFSKMKISQSGDLNTNKLYLYKTDDNIFKSREIINDDKSHGIVMFVDYSSSMAPIISAVRIQMLQIAEFCRLTNIPFEIFAFSDSADARLVVKDQLRQHNKDKQYHYHYSSHALLNVMSSKMNREEYTAAKKTITASLRGSRWQDYSTRDIERLHQTPLSAAKFDAVGIMSKFKKENPTIQKFHTIFITDGCASDSMVNKNMGISKPVIVYAGNRQFSYVTPDQNRTQLFGYTAYQNDFFLYSFFKKYHPDVEFTNLFLSTASVESSPVRQTYKSYGYPSYVVEDKYKKEYQEKGMFKSKSDGVFDNEFVINANILQGKIRDGFTTSRVAIEDEDELTESFETSLILRKRRNAISRKIAEFLS